MRVDLTINVPTILSLLASIVTISSVGVGLYYGLDKRQMAVEIEVARIDKRLEKAEIAIGGIKQENAVQQAALRTEMKGDISEIKDMLNRLIFSSPAVTRQPTRQQLDEWRTK